jgi:hypothetical protein
MELAHDLVRRWKQALAEDLQAQTDWQLAEGGAWTWQRDGLHAESDGNDWSGMNWQRCGEAALRGLKNFVIEVRVSGKAEAAGLSFGAYKDFLVPLEPEMGIRYLQVEVDLTTDRWAFRVDGRLMARDWWDSAIQSTQDIVSGVFTLKGQRIEHVLFQDLAIHTFASSCQVSIVIPCYRFLQRLKVSLHNWCHQEVSPGTYEVLVVNPESPDGTHEYLNAVASSYPHVRVREVAVETSLATNKGKMINRAVAASQGEWTWLTDADALFAPDRIATVLPEIKERCPYLFYGQRRYLTIGQTNALIAGRIDGIAEFEAMAQSALARGSHNAPWGYTQIAHRSVMEQVRYREEINHFAQSDMLFIEDCKRRRIMPQQIERLVCLHLEHPFAWYGTSTFL